VFPASKKISKAIRFEPSLTIQKLGVIELFIMSVKKKNAKAAKLAAKQMHVF